VSEQVSKRSTTTRSPSLPCYCCCCPLIT
jgi:hypothetical protein